MTIREIFASDRRIVRVVVYCDGWVPNSYKWPAPGRSLTFYRAPDTGTIRSVETEYDRKRSIYAARPTWVAFSERGGRLASGREFPETPALDDGMERA